jgi:hypothetical protein
MYRSGIVKQLTDNPYQWTPRRRSTLGQKPIMDSVPWSPGYGPHICPQCYGAGWAVNRSGNSELFQCGACSVVDNQRIASCWTVSGLNPNDAAAPSLVDFSPRDKASIELRAAALKFADVPRGWVTFYGSPGGGKSHLAEAIARALLARRVPALFAKSVHLWEYLGATYRNEGDDVDYTSRQRWVADVAVLVIDEMGVEKDTETVFKLRRTLLDHRYRNATAHLAGATVLVSNTAPAKWSDGALADRVLDTRFTCLECSRSSYRRVAR